MMDVHVHDDDMDRLMRHAWARSGVSDDPSHECTIVRVECAFPYVAARWHPLQVGVRESLRLVGSVVGVICV